VVILSKERGFLHQGELGGIDCRVASPPAGRAPRNEGRAPRNDVSAIWYYKDWLECRDGVSYGHTPHRVQEPTVQAGDSLPWRARVYSS